MADVKRDLADVKRDLAETREDLGGKIGGLSARMDRFERYLTFSMGLNDQTRLDVQHIEADFAGLRSRIEELERQD